MRSLGVTILVGTAVIACALVWWRSGSSAASPSSASPGGNDTGASNAGRISGQPELSSRVMASKGFIPPGAPIAPPAHPTPRRGAVAADFADLSGFEFEMESEAVPDAIEAMRGRLVEVIGVMYFSVEDPDRVTEFYLMPDHTICCFGTPRINQIVDVQLPAGKATRYALDYYLVRGVLEIGPFFDESGLALCLYRIADAELEFLE
jgi:hypothetical protein